MDKQHRQISWRDTERTWSDLKRIALKDGIMVSQLIRKVIKAYLRRRLGK